MKSLEINFSSQTGAGSRRALGAITALEQALSMASLYHLDSSPSAGSRSTPYLKPPGAPAAPEYLPAVQKLVLAETLPNIAKNSVGCRIAVQPAPASVDTIRATADYASLIGMS
jgi:hypothetical protein